MAQSSLSSGICFEGDGPSQVVRNSQRSSNSGNSLNALPGHAHGIMDRVSDDPSKTLLNSVASSGPSVGASSLVTDANSGLSGGPHLQRSASINTESYMRLPASPMSFSSNNISISGSSVMDGSSTMQRNSNPDPGSQVQQSQQHQGASCATSLPTSRMGQVQFPGGQGVPSYFFQDPTNISQLLKKPRLDSKQEDILQNQVLQQLMHRQDPIHLQNPNLQLQALMQQQRLIQQQLLSSLSPMQRALFLQQQQMFLKQHLQQPGVQAESGIKRPYDGGVCSRRLMQYLYHQRQRPAENTIAYWRKFVAEYYSPRAKKRWCLSLYDNIRHHSPGVFPQAATDAWHCDICGSKPGRGFEATSEVLPRLNEIKFGSGVIDELLFLDFPRENRFPSGMMMLEYAKAVQESVYEQFRVVSEGQLRIIFTPDLKILSWEFCARRHEELIPRRLVTPQVYQLLQVAQKCHDTISESGPNGISPPDLQANSAMIEIAGRQLARSLELQSLNDLGFPKRYVRCLQIAEVVGLMKNLMEFCREQKAGPIEGLKIFPRPAILSNVQSEEVEPMGGLQDLPTDNKLMVLHAGINGLANNNPLIVGNRALSGSEQTALSSTNFQNVVMRQNSISSTHNSMQFEGSSPFSIASQPPSSMTPKPSMILPGTLQSPPVSGILSSQLPQQGSSLQQQMFQQLLQDMNNNKNNKSAVGHPPSRRNSFRYVSNGEYSPSAHNVGFGQTTSELPQNLHSSTGIIQDILPEFSVNDFFNNDFDDNMNFSWKV